MVAGRLVALGAPDEIGGVSRSSSEVSFRLPEGVAVSEVPDLGSPLVARGADWQLRTSTPTLPLSRLTAWAEGRGHELAGLSVARPSLEDVYLELIQDEANTSHDAELAPR